MKQDEEITHRGVAGLSKNLVSTCDAIKLKLLNSTERSNFSPLAFSYYLQL